MIHKIFNNLIYISFILLFTFIGNDITILFNNTNYLYQLFFLIFILFLFYYKKKIIATLFLILFILQIKLLFNEEH